MLARVEEVVMSLEYLKGTPLESFPNPLRDDYPEYMDWIEAKETHRRIIQKRSNIRRKDTLKFIEELKSNSPNPMLVQLKAAVLHYNDLFSLSTIHEICEKVDEVCGE